MRAPVIIPRPLVPGEDEGGFGKFPSEIRDAVYDWTAD
jgi:hypothetical protein